MWVPVGTSANRDWMQIGALNYPKPGTSFKEANKYQAPWSNDDNQKLEFTSMMILKSNCQWIKKTSFFDKTDNIMLLIFSIFCVLLAIVIIYFVVRYFRNKVESETPERSPDLS